MKAYTIYIKTRGKLVVLNECSTLREANKLCSRYRRSTGEHTRDVDIREAEIVLTYWGAIRKRYRFTQAVKMLQPKQSEVGQNP